MLSGRINSTRRGLCHSWRALGHAFVIFVLAYALATLLQHRNQAFKVGFGGHPDEPAHFVTGMMVYRYVTDGLGSSPMAFAERFYIHYPAVAFGHWPPLFYVLQAAWGVVFGFTRETQLGLMAVLCGALATSLVLSLRSRLSTSLAVAAGALLVTLPLVQRHTSMVMAEVPLALFACASTVAVARFTRHPDRMSGLALGCAISGAILVKGNGLGLLGLLLLPFANRQRPAGVVMQSLWWPLAVILTMAVPFTALTARMSVDGRIQALPSLDFIAQSLGDTVRAQHQLLGAPLLLLAVVGAGVVSWHRWSQQADWFWPATLVTGVVMFLFQVVVPSSTEPRQLAISVPALLALAALALETIHVRLSTWSRHAGVLVPVVICAGLIASFVAQPATSSHVNTRAAAQQTRVLPSRVLLVSSDSADEREELSFVAELAALNQADMQRAVIRAGKFVADSSWLGAGYTLTFRDPQALRQAMDAVPVSSVVLFTGAKPGNKHSALLDVTLHWWPGWQLSPPPGSSDASYALWHRDDPADRPVVMPSANLVRKIGKSVQMPF